MSKEERWTQEKEWIAWIKGWIAWIAESHLDCSCDFCHKGHIENGEVPENVKSPDFECCKIELQSWIEKKEWCPVDGHGDSDLNPDGSCNTCLMKN